MRSDLDLLAIEFQTLFLTTASGRIERENDPDRSAAPKLWFAGCESGNVAALRYDVREELAARILALVATEPPFFTREYPERLDRYIDLLRTPAQHLGLIYELPHDLKSRREDVPLIDSESHEGKRLHASLSSNGMPAGLLELGFRDASEFWEPWCVALGDGQVASVAFAARLSESGAELGIATVPALRGRGYAKLATAGWSRLQSLRSRALFYSTDRTNAASRRVAARLGLRFIGASLRLS